MLYVEAVYMRSWPVARHAGGGHTIPGTIEISLPPARAMEDFFLQSNQPRMKTENEAPAALAHFAATAPISHHLPGRDCRTFGLFPLRAHAAPHNLMSPAQETRRRFSGASPLHNDMLR
jgi:hypothetical protein